MRSKWSKAWGCCQGCFLQCSSAEEPKELCLPSQLPAASFLNPMQGKASPAQQSQNRSGQASGMQVPASGGALPLRHETAQSGPRAAGPARGRARHAGDALRARRAVLLLARPGSAAPGPARIGDRGISPGLSRRLSRSGEGGARTRRCSPTPGGRH